ncbi:MAG: hypothetical protein ACLPKB_29715 [Xanthobacteraceae bacterium]
MKKFLTIAAVLTAVATPALAQTSTDRGAVVKYRTQIQRTQSEQSIPGMSFDEVHAGAGY